LQLQQIKNGVADSRANFTTFYRKRSKLYIISYFLDGVIPQAILERHDASVIAIQGESKRRTFIKANADVSSLPSQLASRALIMSLKVTPSFQS